MIFLAAWKIIKSWLPAAAVKKIKFLTKANILEYVAEDQRPEAWGGKLAWMSWKQVLRTTELNLQIHFIKGTDDWVYQWEDEEIIHDIQ